jgi:hypothetical protein
MSALVIKRKAETLSGVDQKFSYKKPPSAVIKQPTYLLSDILRETRLGCRGHKSDCGGLYHQPRLVVKGFFKFLRIKPLIPT